MDYSLEEMATLQAANEQKVTDIQRLNNQLSRALEVEMRRVFRLFLFDSELLDRQTNSGLERRSGERSLSKGKSEQRLFICIYFKMISEEVFFRSSK